MRKLLHRPSLLLAALCCLIAVGCRDAVRIHQIQGRSHQSPLAGTDVRGVTGVVTAVDADSGFWMQDGEGDGDDATSEGLYVSTGAVATDVDVGQAVTVDGRVEEAADPERDGDLTTTRLAASSVRVLAEGRETPAPMRLGKGGRRPPPVIDDDSLERFEPGSDALDFFESLEGMRVEVAGAVVVGPTSRHGEVVVLADGGADSGPRSRRGGVLLAPGGGNPERLLLAPRLLRGRMPDLDVGARFTGPITGVLAYGFGNFKLLPESLPRADGADPPDETTELRPGERRLTLATFNLYNVSARNSPEKLGRLATTLVRDLAAPDVVALQEVQDGNGPDDRDSLENDPTVTAAPTFEALIAAVTEAGGPRYDFRQIDPVDDADGGQPGGNIRVGFLFQPARVAFVDRGRAGAVDAVAVETGEDGVRLTLSPGRVAPRDPAFENSRKPLAGEFVFRGRKIFAIVTHLNSKGGDDALMGRRQPPRRPTEEKRGRQVRAIRALMENLLEHDPDARVVVLGDMNELEFRPPIEALVGSRWANLIDRVAPEERYTYVYEGNSQVLDHVVVSPALAAGAAPEVDIVHVNADLAESRRGSDHDPVVVRLSIE